MELHDTQKGISPFIGVIILLAVSVAVASVVLLFVGETSRESGESLEDYAGGSINCDLAGVLVTDALFRFPASSVSGSNYTTVEVENRGAVRLNNGVVVAAFDGSSFVNSTDQLAALDVEETRSVTFLTNVTNITKVQARAVDCGEKSSTSEQITRESYVSEPSSGVN